MNAAAAFAELEGRVVDSRFRLLRRLGGTGVSALYLTELEGAPSRRAAIKLVAANARDAEARLAGWTAIARLSHPSLIQVFHVGRCGIEGNRVVYAVMELADEVLAGVLPERSLSEDETRDMVKPVLKALMYLHSQGYVHGRLKPSNILVVEDQVKLSAECIALAASAGVERDDLSVYDAPELVRGIVLPAADVWSMGMTLVAALTREPAHWERKSSEDPVLPEGIPEPYASIARLCLRLDPARRIALDQIMEILDPQPADKVAKRIFAGPANPNRRKAVIAAAVVVAVVAGAALFVRSRQGPASGSTAAEQQSAAGSATEPTKPLPSERNRQGAARPKTGAGTGKPEPVDGVVKRVMPDVLPAAQQTILGHVNVGVRVTVDAAGNVTDVTMESPGRSKYFNRLALDAARQWVFVSADTGSSTASRAWTVQFDFHQEGIDASATPE